MTVHLVGAGPGDPDLLTIRAVELIGRAEVIVHDRLIDPRVLELASHKAELIDVGKHPGAPADSQQRINDILIDRGRRRDPVVRLKGGDPFVFGRGVEEAVALRAAGIDVAEGPGITSAIAAPSAAGVPVTMRGVSSGFTVITAHQDPTTDQWLDWDALAHTGTTLVILMGASRRHLISERLLMAGMRADMPVAVIHAATTRAQSISRTSLAELPYVDVTNPATIVVGPVAAESVITPTILSATESLQAGHIR